MRTDRGTAGTPLDRPQEDAVVGRHTVVETNGSDAPNRPDSHEAWTERTRIVLMPVAAPSILGLFGFAAATFMVATTLAGWWGNPVTAAPELAPFALFFGGLAQLLAAMWSYRARDGLATAVHGTWGSFWLAWGFLVLLTTMKLLPPSVLSGQPLGFWFIVLAVVTGFCALASVRENLGLFAVLFLLTAGSILLAIGFVGAIAVAATAGGWVLAFSAIAAFYTAGAMMLAEATKGRTVLPLGTYRSAANVPGRLGMEPIGYPGGLPGARVGQ